MPGQAPLLHDERELLLAFIAQQRDGIRYAAYGLHDDQARQTPTAGTLSIGGLVKHAAHMEQSWIDTVEQRPAGSFEESMAAYEANFRLGPDETLADALALLDAAAERTAGLVGSITDLSQAVPVPKGVPWYPDDLEAWSVRWVLLHLVEELARHAGHADIVREAVDGATMYELMAGAEGWPETDWIKPWRPPTS
jgi:hypothetical protein